MAPNAAKPSTKAASLGVFAGLWVFAGPFTASAAQLVVRPDHTLADAARVLATLADQHLLHVDPGYLTRYRFQEVVRQYAAELLADAAGEVQQSHGRWVADELASLASSGDDETWCAVFDQFAVEARAALSRPIGVRDLGELFAEQFVQRGGLE